MGAKYSSTFTFTSGPAQEITECLRMNPQVIQSCVLVGGFGQFQSETFLLSCKTEQH